jgi:hypothetical protein
MTPETRAALLSERLRLAASLYDPGEYSDELSLTDANEIFRDAIRLITATEAWAKAWRASVFYACQETHEAWEQAEGDLLALLPKEIDQ